MNKKIIWISIVVIVLLIVLYFIYKQLNKTETTVTTSVSPRGAGEINSLSSMIVSNGMRYNYYPLEYLNQFDNPELIRVK